MGKSDSTEKVEDNRITARRLKLQNIIDEGFKNRRLSFLYYTYLKTFHVEPKSFYDLLDSSTFSMVQSNLDGYLESLFESDSKGK